MFTLSCVFVLIMVLCYYNYIRCGPAGVKGYKKRVQTRLAASYSLTSLQQPQPESECG